MVNSTIPYYLYVFWLNSTTSQISGKYSINGGAGWNWATYITANIDNKGHITSVYEVTRVQDVGWQWVNRTINYDVLFESIPEFEGIIVPICGLMAFFMVFRGKSKRRKGKK